MKYTSEGAYIGMIKDQQNGIVVAPKTETKLSKFNTYLNTALKHNPKDDE